MKRSRCDGSSTQNSIGAGLAQLLDRKDLCDVALVSGLDKKSVPAVRALLSIRSKFFGELLCSTEFKGGRPTEVKVPEVDSSTLRAVVEYCYTDDQDLLHLGDRCRVSKKARSSESGASDLLMQARGLAKLALAAEYFQLQELVLLACRAAKDAVETMPELACVFLGALHGRAGHNPHLTRLISALLERICKSPRASLTANGDMVLELAAPALKDALLKVNKCSAEIQSDLFEAVRRWALDGTDGGSEGRKVEAADIVAQCLTLDHMPASFLLGKVAPSGLAPSEKVMKAAMRQAKVAEDILGTGFYSDGDGVKEWKIKDWSIIRHDCEQISSKDFKIGSYSWRLDLFFSATSRSMTFYLCVPESECEFMASGSLLRRGKFSIKVITPGDPLRRISSSREMTTWVKGDVHGGNGKVIETAKLNGPDATFIVDDTLTVRVQVKDVIDLRTWN